MNDCTHDLRHSPHDGDYVFCTKCDKEWKPKLNQVYEVKTGNCDKSGSTDYTCICKSNHNCAH